MNTPFDAIMFDTDLAADAWIKEFSLRCGQSSGWAYTVQGYQYSTGKWFVPISASANPFLTADERNRLVTITDIYLPDPPIVP